MNFKVTIMLFFCLLIGSYGYCQNGKILDKNPYTLGDSTINSLRKRIPDIDSIMNAVNFYRITYLSDGLKVKGFLATPKEKGSYPSVIYNRGGNRELGALNDYQIICYLGNLARWGYVAVGSQYRGNGGSEGKEEFGGEDVNDVLNLIPFLSNIECADTSRIGMWGWSRGGMMSYLALTKTCNIKASVIGSGMADGFVMTSMRPAMDTVYAALVQGYKENRDSLLKTRSAVYWADKLCKTTPILLLAGSADWRVSPEEQFNMVSALQKVKHPFRFVFYEGGDHGLSEYYYEVNLATKVFLDKYVRDKEKYPSLEPHGK